MNYILMSTIFVAILTSSVALSAEQDLSSLKVQDGIDQSYSGKYVKDEKYLLLLKKLYDFREEAIKNIQQRTGLTYIDDNKIILRFADDNGEGKLHAGTSTGEINGRRAQAVTIYLEYFITGQIDIKKELSHEFIHAIMREKMQEKYRSLPKWLREGIAVWGASQLEERGKVIIAGTIFSNDTPLSLINGLENKSHRFEDYMEDALLFEFISQKRGVENVKSVISSVVSGRDHKTVLSQETNMEWNKLQDSLKTFSIDYVNNMLFQGGYPYYQKAYELYKAEQYEEAISNFQSFIREFPESFLIPNSWYMIGKCQYILKRYSDAMEAFQIVLERHPRYNYLQDDSQYRLAKSFTQMKEYDKAIDAFNTLFRNYCYAPKDLLSDAHYFLGNTYLDKQDYLAAIKEYNIALNGSKKYVEDAHYMLGVAYYRKGDISKAKQTFKEFLKKYPQTKLKPKVQEYLRLIVTSET